VNRTIGASIARFVEKIAECRYVIVVGTPLYWQKAKVAVSEGGSVVSSEWDLMSMRLLTGEEQHRRIIPALLEGSPEESLPPLLRGRVYCRFSKGEKLLWRTFRHYPGPVPTCRHMSPGLPELRIKLLELGE